MSELLAAFAYVRGFEDQYGDAVRAIEAAADRGADHVQREQKKLLRPDGTRRLMLPEHEEQTAGIFAAAAAEYDKDTARYLETARKDQESAERSLALLLQDPFDKLKPDEQARAAARREFVKEDAERLPTEELLVQARAAMASKDRVSIFLWGRYIGQLLDLKRARQEYRDPDLVAVVQELRPVFTEGDPVTKRQEFETRVRAAKTLPLAVEKARRRLDGSEDRMLAGLRGNRL